MVKGKRANITQEGERTIMDAALTEPRLPRPRLAENLQAVFRSKKWDVPEVEVLERKISKYRKQAGYAPQNKPWSITASFAPEVNIPPEAIGDLLAVWKVSLRAGRKFTIREAKWVARLRSALPGATPNRLYEVAIAYSRLDQTAEGMKQHLPGTDLDAELAFQREKSSMHE